MISDLKAILTEIRKERSEELLRYVSHCGDKTRCENRKAILLLELPYKTDSLDLLHARASASRDEDDIKIRKKNDSGLTLLDNFFERWICSGDSDDVKNERQTFYNLIRKIITGIQKRNPRWLTLDTVHCVLTYEAMAEVINQLDIDPSSKEIYLSHARSLDEYMRKTYPISCVLFGRRSHLTLSDISKLFEYLEARALKSSTPQKYEDLLLCRALFYAPLPTKDFFNLELLEEHPPTLKSKDAIFPIPQTFLKLWKGFGNSDRLFSQVHDDRGLNKKIKRLGKYAELSIPSLTPSILRESGRGAYYNHLSLDEKELTFLPKR